MSALAYLNQLTRQLSFDRHRSGVMLMLTDSDLKTLLEGYIQAQHSNDQSIKEKSVAILGSYIELEGNVEALSYKQGHQLLGQEISTLIVDCTDGFDANSFSAALGALMGGGLVFIANVEKLDESNSKAWLSQHFQSWTVIDDLNVAPDTASLKLLPSHMTHSAFIGARTADQSTAITAIKKVLSGHRKRPLVINANRGRGKTSCLGMAAAELMFEKACQIMVTAPALKSIEPLFAHVQLELNKLEPALIWSKKTKTEWQLSNGASLRFCAPDELLLTRPSTDLLFVDEAAALPLSSLQDMVTHYHRVVFSSTTHGYEGCGRGFTLKFMSWLNQNRPGWKLVELIQPIRWNENDPLESWLFDTFLLDADNSNSVSVSVSLADKVALKSIDKSQLLHHPSLFREIFALLVNAHYQTSPNDLIQILDDDSIEVIQIISGDVRVGCLLLTLEGGLDDSLIIDIQRGNRRPKGHLAASYLCNHLALSQAASQRSARVMRIAIGSNFQRLGIGSNALSLLVNHLAERVDFISVSFGASTELVKFWRKDFQLVSLGTRRDQASGCYSAFMVRALSVSSQDWIQQASQDFLVNIQISLPFIYNKLESDCLMAMLQPDITHNEKLALPALVSNYAQGGNSYESVSATLNQYLWQSLFRSPLERSHENKCVLDKVLFSQSWQEVSAKYGLNGRKDIEARIRQYLLSIHPYST